MEKVSNVFEWLQIDNFFINNIECHPFFHGFYWENVSEM